MSSLESKRTSYRASSKVWVLEKQPEREEPALVEGYILSDTVESGLHWLINSKEYDIDGRRVKKGEGIYQKNDLKDVGDWMAWIKTYGLKLINVKVGMLNGLLTRCSDFAGEGALDMAERMCEGAGYPCRFYGTNDDATAIVAIPMRVGIPNEDEIYTGISTATHSLSIAMAFYDITTNKGKMNIGSQLQELNTVTKFINSFNMSSFALPYLREAEGALNAVSNPSSAGSAFEACNAATSAQKEGADLMVAIMVLMAKQKARLETIKLNSVALASASHVKHPGGFKFYTGVAPHGNGLPDFRTILSGFSGMERAGYLICERLLLNCKEGEVPRTKNGVRKDDLIHRVSIAMCANAIGQACTILGGNAYEVTKHVGSLKGGFGIFDALPISTPTRFEVRGRRMGNKNEEILDHDTLNSLPLSSVLSGGTGTVQNTGASVIRSIIASIEEDITRPMSSLQRQALHMFSIGKVATKEDGTPWPWNPDIDDSNEPHIFIISKPTIINGMWKRLSGRCSLWWLLESWDRHEWDAPIPYYTPLMDLLAAGMEASIRDMFALTKAVTAGTALNIVTGLKPSMDRCKSVNQPERYIMTATQIAATLNPDPIMKAAISFMGYISGRNTQTLYNDDMSVLGHHRAANLDMGDLKTLEKVAYIMGSMLSQTTLKDFLVPSLLREPSALDLGVYLAGHIGGSLRPETPILVPAPSQIRRDITMPTGIGVLDTAATKAIMHFLLWKPLSHTPSREVRGVLPSAAVSAKISSNLLNTNSFRNTVLGLKAAAGENLVLDLDNNSYRMLLGEPNHERLVYVHQTPSNPVSGEGGKSVKGVRGVRIYLPHNEYGSKVAYCLATVVQETILESENGSMTWVNPYTRETHQPIQYRYTHHFYTPITQEEVLNGMGVLEFSFTYQNVKKRTVLTTHAFHTGQFFIKGDLALIHWKPTLFACISCFPPYICLKEIDSEDCIPIMPVEPMCVIREDDEAIISEPPGPEVFGESNKTGSMADYSNFVTGCILLITESHGTGISHAILAGFRTNTPWQCLREFACAVQRYTGLLDGQTVFARQYDTMDFKQRHQSLDPSLIADLMIGNSKLIEILHRKRESNTSAKFFEDRLTSSIIIAVRRAVVDEELTPDTLSTDILYDPREVEAAPPTKELVGEIRFVSRILGEKIGEFAVPKPFEKIDADEKAGVYDEDYDLDKLRDRLMDIPRSKDNLPIGNWGDEEESDDYNIEDEIDLMRSRMEKATETVVNIHVTSDSKIECPELDDCGIQEDDGRRYADDYVDGGDTEGEIIPDPEERIDKTDYSYNAYKTIHAASIILGLITVEMMKVRGRNQKGRGGRGVWRPLELWGKRATIKEQQGYKWMRVPAVAYTNILNPGREVNLAFQGVVFGYLEGIDGSLVGSASVPSDSLSNQDVIEVMSVKEMLAPRTWEAMRAKRIQEEIHIGESIVKVGPSFTIYQTGGAESQDSATEKKSSSRRESRIEIDEVLRDQPGEETPFNKLYAQVINKSNYKSKALGGLSNKRQARWKEDT